MPNEPRSPLSAADPAEIQVIIEGMKELEISSTTEAMENLRETRAGDQVKPVGRPRVEPQGLRFTRFFSHEGNHPFDELEWEKRDAIITNDKGVTVFKQEGVEVPVGWSQQATNIVVSKYFRGQIGTPGRETSVRQVVGRVATTIADWGRQGGYFATPADALAFEHELAAILVTQRAAFNSPVWFNVGVESHPQCSACFINSVEDNMRSILQLAVTEGMLFKYGSGTGSNFSTLRSSREKLGNSDGKSSGPVSFMRGFDAFAGVIKSGGKTRRAAKMVILNVDHPDIREFVGCKAHEEQKAWALIEAGYDGSFTGEAYRSVFYQNANHSVRVSDEFMRAVESNSDWTTRAVLTGQPVDSFPAMQLMHEIGQACWICGDPGMQYHTTINRWHTCPNTGPINASNPCSEYMFLDDTACNLASINLMLFRTVDGGFDVAAFKNASAVIITAMEIAVGNSSYPTEKIAQNSHLFRPLGIGYANLGALLMARGLPYDSDEARSYAAAITSLMSGWTYRQSALIAAEVGAFEGYAVNREPMLKVMGMHRDASHTIAGADKLPSDLLDAAQEAWDEAVVMGEQHGYRNSQISVLAPTGTIAFMMDCDTTGVEPDIALVKYKWLVGGGMMKIVNRTVPEALDNLGYTAGEKAAILAHVEAHDTIEGAPGLKPEHLPVFDCAFKPANGTRSIHYRGHIRMMAAVQPFLSGAISKTVNMPEASTAEEIEQTYLEAWKLGLKAIAIYRDGCKRSQPLTMKKEEVKGQDTENRIQKTAETQNFASQQKAVVASHDTGHGIWDEGTSELQNVVASVAATPAPVEVAPAITVPPAAGQSALPLARTNQAYRRRLPEERRAITHKFSIAGHEGYLTVGLFEDGTPGELFLTMNKQGSVMSGLMDSFAISTSMALQYGVPLRDIVNKFAHVRFEPSGYTNNPHIRIAKSIVDYVARWMGWKFLPQSEHAALGINGIHHDEPTAEAKPGSLEAMVQSELAANKAENAEGGVEDTGHRAQDRGHRTEDMESVPVVETQNIESLNTGTPEHRNTPAAPNDLNGTFQQQKDAPPCDTCGALMVRNGACYKCLNCGSVSGCS